MRQQKTNAVLFCPKRNLFLSDLLTSNQLVTEGWSATTETAKMKTKKMSFTHCYVELKYGCEMERKKKVKYTLSLGCFMPRASHDLTRLSDLI